MDGEARSAAELEDGEARSAAELEDGAGVAQGGGEGITAAAAAAATPGTAASPVAVRLARKVAYEYNIGSTLSVLFSYKGTFWPLLLRKHELYLYPLLHTGFVLAQWSWQQQADDRHVGGVDSGRGTFWRTVFEATADDGVNVGPKEYWEKSNMMIPWQATGTLTPLMVFALVFFLSECYSRFMTFFYACELMETAIQDMTVLMLVHAKGHEQRWDAVRYLTAAAITTFARARANRVWDEPKKDLDEASWKRLRSPERTWHAAGVPDTIPGWPRSVGDEELAHTEKMHELGTSAAPPEPQRPTSCPALLKVHEVDALRCYPDSMVGLVLVTWCVQTLKELERNGELTGPAFGQAQGSALKLQSASCKICNLLNLPIPLPYFHTLVVLQNVCFAIMSWSLLSFVSFLTPIVLFFAVLCMVGLREVAVALSNPFGKDDVDFPIDKWIAQLRSNALLVHRDNRLVRLPSHETTQTGPNVDDEEDEEDEDEDADGVGAGAGGDDGGGGGGGDDKDENDEMGGF